MGVTQPAKSDLRSFLEDPSVACKKEQQYGLAEFWPIEKSLDVLPQD